MVTLKQKIEKRLKEINNYLKEDSKSDFAKYMLIEKRDLIWFINEINKIETFEDIK